MSETGFRVFIGILIGLMLAGTGWMIEDAIKRADEVTWFAARCGAGVVVRDIDTNHLRCVKAVE